MSAADFAQNSALSNLLIFLYFPPLSRLMEKKFWTVEKRALVGENAAD
jgi:hypothetical protein